MADKVKHDWNTVSPAIFADDVKKAWDTFAAAKATFKTALEKALRDGPETAALAKGKAVKIVYNDAWDKVSISFQDQVAASGKLNLTKIGGGKAAK